MDLVERYVNDVGRRLPRAQRDEVRRELRSAVLDALEGAQGEQGGEPSEEEVVRALKELGPPAEMAASYRPASRYLIGPELYPLFKMVLGIVLTALAGVMVGVFALNLFVRSGESAELGRRLLALVGGILDSAWVAFVMVVLVFAVLQRLEIDPGKDDRDWDPRDLPAVSDSDLISRGEAVFSIVAPLIVVALLYLFRDRLGIAASPGGELLLKDIARRFLPWVSAVFLLGSALHTYLFWRGRWQWPTRLLKFAIDLFGIAVIYHLAVAISAERAVIEAAGLPRPFVMIIVRVAWGILIVAAGSTLVDAGKTVARLVRGS